MNKTNDNWKRFGRWVAEKRESLGLTQSDLASRIGRDRQTVYRIENGDATKRPTVIKLAEALGQQPATALNIAFGATEKEMQPKYNQDEIISCLQGLNERQLEDILIMVRALSAKQAISANRHDAATMIREAISRVSEWTLEEKRAVLEIIGVRVEINRPDWQVSLLPF